MTGPTEGRSVSWFASGTQNMPFLGSLVVLCGVVWMFAQMTFGPEARLTVIENRQADIIESFDDIEAALDRLSQSGTTIAVMSLNLETALATGSRNRENLDNLRAEVSRLKDIIADLRSRVSASGAKGG